MRTDSQRIENNHSNIKLIYVIIATNEKIALKRYKLLNHNNINN